MLRVLSVYLAISLSTSVFVSCNDNSAPAPTTNPDTANANKTSEMASPARAKEGDTVWVIVNHVKAAKRQQFEQFVHTSFWDSASKLSAADQQVFRQTRVLHPTAAEKDGSYSYLFVMDSYVPGGNYDIQSLLKKMYSTNKATEYNQLFEECMASPQTVYITVQSRH